MLTLNHQRWSTSGATVSQQFDALGRRVARQSLAGMAWGHSTLVAE